MLYNSGLSKGFWGEVTLRACNIPNNIPNKRNNATLMSSNIKRKPKLNYFKPWGCQAIVRLLDVKKELWVKEDLIAFLYWEGLHFFFVCS